MYANSTGQIPDIAGFRGLVDRDTPDDALTRTGFDGHEYTLVFSDEFEQEGRTFNEGDDPYWTAIDSHYCECAHGVRFSVLRTAPSVLTPVDLLQTAQIIGNTMVSLQPSRLFLAFPSFAYCPR